MNRWYLVSVASIGLTILLVLLWLFIPGFPLLIFLLFPPLFWWGSQTPTKDQPVKEDATTPEMDQLTSMPPSFCSRCGKRIVEPIEPYCSRCGSDLREEEL